MRKSAAIACSLIWLTGFIAHQASAGSAPDKIKFPYSPMSWNSLPWWVAKDAGHFDKNSFDVDFFMKAHHRRSSRRCLRAKPTLPVWPGHR